jgi:ribonuclease BN (tRNA processing enzyme)
MKITFLGTAAGLPRKGQSTSSAMIEAGGKYYIFDTGAPVVNKLLDMDKTIEDIRAVFITHCHGDHLFGILDLIRCVNIEKIFPKSSVSYYLPEQNVIDAIEDYYSAVSGAIRKDVNRLFAYTSGVVYSDENIKVTAIPTEHLKIAGRPGFAFSVEGEGKRVLFSGDLSQNLEFDDFPKDAFSREYDAIVCEGAHFDYEVLKPYIKKCRTKRVFFNHQKLPNMPIIEAENRSGEYLFPLILVNDGDCFEL